MQLRRVASPMIRATIPHSPEDQGQYSQSASWPDMFVDPVTLSAASHPSQPAIVDHHRRFNYSELDEAIGGYATVLCAAGVREHDTVVLVASNDCPSVIAFHAIRRLNAISVLVSDHATRSEIAYVLQRTEPRLAIAPRYLLTELIDQNSSVEWYSSEEAISAGDFEPFAGVPATPNEPGIVLFTSGSTARPKGVIHSLNTLRASSAMYIKAAALKQSDVIFLISPLSSVTGVLQGLFMAPMLGSCVILENRWDDALTFDLMMNERATFYGGPDVVLRRLMDEADRRGLSSLPLRAVSVGGTLLDDALLRRAEKMFGIFVMRAYGSSEVPFSTTTPLELGFEERIELDGRPNDEVSVRIGSSQDESECLVRGPHRFLGYLDEEDNTDSFEEGWFRTGDAATWRGDELKIVGRLKEIVIRNGLKISMTAVEHAARKLPFVEDAAVFGVPDQETGERLVLALRPRDGAKIDFNTLMDALLETGLAKRSLPEELVIWDAPFPRTVTDKLRRPALAVDSVDRPHLFGSRLKS